jgi:excisionase family DNA binding protein
MARRRQTIRKQPAEPASAFITIREAAAQLGISEGLAYRMANEYLASHGSGGLPCVRFGRRLLVSRGDIANLVQLNLNRIVTARSLAKG